MLEENKRCILKNNCVDHYDNNSILQQHYPLKRPVHKYIGNPLKKRMQPYAVAAGYRQKSRKINNLS